MKRVYSIVAAAAIMATAVQAADTKAKDGVSFNIEDRMRYEGVSEAASVGKADATAITNRFLLGAKYKAGNLTLNVEGVNISAIDDAYDDNDGDNGVETDGSKTYSKVVDAEQTRLTQAKLTYTAGKTAVIAGRQMVNLDNQRFVGAVAWRQMFQTFDALLLQNKSADKLTLSAAYIVGVNGINTDKSTGGADGAFKTESAILHANYKANKTLDVTAYAYLLGSLHDTYGITFKGGEKFKYRLEYAMQTDASLELDATTDIETPASGPSLADASYMNIDLAYTLDKAMTVGLNYEVLSGTDGTGTATAFSTPLATAHKFNGWADKFLGTPDTGLVDTNVRFMYKTKEAGKFLAVYHTFDTDAGTSVNYGTEMDLLYTNKISSVKGLSYLLKYADFAKGDTVSPYTDATKVWASLTYKFASK